MSSTPLRPDLDDAIDDAVRALTDVERLEARSRQRTLARLAAATDGRRVLDRRHAWATLATATLVAAIALVWTMRQPAGVRSSDVRGQHAERTTPRAVEPSRHVAEVVPRTAAAAPPAAAPPTASSEQRRAARPARLPAPRAQGPETADRLAVFIRAVRTLPPDVWERLDTAGPPAPVPPLAVDEMSTAPITIEPLPSGEWADPSAPPGGFK